MNLKTRIKDGCKVFGTWCLLPSPEVINVLAKAGLDFVLIDMEHGAIDFALAQKMVMAAEADGCEAVIRVARNDEADILRALDTGAGGVIVPHVENVADCALAIGAMKYPPVGVRGFSPYTRAGGYASSPGHTERENRRVLTGIIIEGEEGLQNLSQILEEPELDLVYIGSYDLSVVLGVPGQVMHEKVQKVLMECVVKVRASGKAAGCLFHNPAELTYFGEVGITFLAYKVDSSVLYDGFSFLKEYNR